jgi:hypothetical protein
MRPRPFPGKSSTNTDTADSLNTLVFSAVDYCESPAPIWRCRLWRNRLRGERSVQQVTNRPDAISDPERNGWRGLKRFMRAAEIVMRDVQRHRRKMVLKTL